MAKVGRRHQICLLPVLHRAMLKARRLHGSQTVVGQTFLRMVLHLSQMDPPHMLRLSRVIVSRHHGRYPLTDALISWTNAIETTGAIRVVTQVETALQRAIQEIAIATATVAPPLPAILKTYDAAGGLEKVKALPEWTTPTAGADTVAAEEATVMIEVATMAEIEVVMDLGAAISGDQSMVGTEMSILTLARAAVAAVAAACATRVRTRELGGVVRNRTARLLESGCVNRFAYMQLCMAPGICVRNGQILGRLCT
jgi:hypothetical protein